MNLMEFILTVEDEFALKFQDEDIDSLNNVSVSSCVQEKKLEKRISEHFYLYKNQL